MFSWWKKKTEEVAARQILQDSLRDFAGDELAQKALQLFDSEGARQQFYEDIDSEPPWAEDGRQPSQAELASELFSQLLISQNYLVVLDWADDLEQVVEGFNQLAQRANVIPLSTPECDEMRTKIEGAQRGEVIERLLPELQKAAKLRERTCVSLVSDSDAHFLMLVAAPIFARWRSEKFGKNYPVLAIH